LIRSLKHAVATSGAEAAARTNNLGVASPFTLYNRPRGHKLEQIGYPSITVVATISHGSFGPLGIPGATPAPPRQLELGPPPSHAANSAAPLPAPPLQPAQHDTPPLPLGISRATGGEAPRTPLALTVPNQVTARLVTTGTVRGPVRCFAGRCRSDLSIRRRA
jgi:hypothetical protein